MKRNLPQLGQNNFAKNVSEMYRILRTSFDTLIQSCYHIYTFRHQPGDIQDRLTLWALNDFSSESSTFSCLRTSLAFGTGMATFTTEYPSCSRPDDFFDFV